MENKENPGPSAERTPSAKRTPSPSAKRTPSAKRGRKRKRGVRGGQRAGVGRPALPDVSQNAPQMPVRDEVKIKSHPATEKWHT